MREDESLSDPVRRVALSMVLQRPTSHHKQKEQVSDEYDRSKPDSYDRLHHSSHDFRFVWNREHRVWPVFVIPGLAIAPSCRLGRALIALGAVARVFHCD